MTTDAYKRKRQELQKSTQDQHDHIRKKAAERVAADEAAAAKEAQVSTMGRFCDALFPFSDPGDRTYRARNYIETCKVVLLVLVEF
jgi:hypothetical protein